MNNFSGKISEIRTSGALSVVSVQINATTSLKAIVVDTPQTADYLSIGQNIQVLFKEIEVIVGPGQKIAISLENQLAGIIASLDKGELLSRLTITTAIGEVVAIISTEAVENLALQPGLTATAMIKLNEIILAP